MPRGLDIGKLQHDVCPAIVEGIISRGAGVNKDTDYIPKTSLLHLPSKKKKARRAESEWSEDLLSFS